MRRVKDKPPPHPISWQVRAMGSSVSGTPLRSVWCVMDEQAPPLREGEEILWKGIATHFTDAYRKARFAGQPIILTTTGEFRLRERHQTNNNPK